MLKIPHILWLLLSSMLLWLAMPGEICLWPLCFVALTPLFAFLWESSELGLRKLAAAGLFFGILHYLLLMYWVVGVLARYGGIPTFLAGSGLFLLAFYMAIYPALFFVFSRLVIGRFSPFSALFLLPTCWVGLDWLRGHLFTGLPWMDVGYALSFQPKLIQLADIFGHYGVSWLLVFINLSLWLLFSLHGGWKERVKIGASLSLVILAAFFYNTSQLQSWHNVQTEMVKVEIVQGNIPQEQKWSPELQEKTLLHYLHLTAQQVLENENSFPDLAIFPETALPFYANSDKLAGVLENFVNDSGIPILTGIPWYEVENLKERKFRFYNAALLLDPTDNKRFSGSYFKSHLVPFGEYVPLQKILFFLGPLVEAAGNFTPGIIDTPISLQTGDGEEMKIGVLICYESIFPEMSRGWAKNGANLLVNITNDAWFGRSSAPWQTLAMTTFRAIENRRAIVRSANTGFSAVITPYGEIKERSELYTETAFLGEIELLSCVTLFVKYGYYFAPLCFAFSLFISFYLLRRWRGERKASCFS